MTMWNTSLVVFKKGALKNIKKYSGLETGKCFDSGFIKEEYNLEDLWRIPQNWYGRIKFLEQMDYGSWLYSCERETLLELLKESGIDHVPVREYKKDEETGECIGLVKKIPVSEIPVKREYGIFEMEVY